MNILASKQHSKEYIRAIKKEIAREGGTLHDKSLVGSCKNIFKRHNDRSLINKLALALSDIDKIDKIAHSHNL